MAEMRIGYGSEYQLLRYLGHHREYLNEEILKALKGVTGSIKWLDYPVDIDRDSMDGEYKNVFFLYGKCFFFVHERKKPQKSVIRLHLFASRFTDSCPIASQCRKGCKLCRTVPH